MLDKEFNYYKENQKQLAEKYSDQFIVIKDNNVIGVYETEQQAYEETIKNHELGTFLIQQCFSEDSVYTQTFYSRAIF